MLKNKNLVNPVVDFGIIASALEALCQNSLRGQPIGITWGFKPQVRQEKRPFVLRSCTLGWPDVVYRCVE